MKVEIKSKDCIKLIPENENEADTLTEFLDCGASSIIMHPGKPIELAARDRYIIIGKLENKKYQGCKATLTLNDEPIAIFGDTAFTSKGKKLNQEELVELLSKRTSENTKLRLELIEASNKISKANNKQDKLSKLVGRLREEIAHSSATRLEKYLLQMTAAELLATLEENNG